MEPYIPDDTSVQKDCRDIKRNLSVIQNDLATIVTIVAVSPDHDLNHLLAIPAECGLPLQGGVYDTVRDCYVMQGVEYERLGTIPVSYSLLDNETEMGIDIPMPPRVVARYLSEKQKKIVARFAEKFKKHRIVYIQFRMAY